MNTPHIKKNADFDHIKQSDDLASEFWYARELMPLLGYKTWEGFSNVIKKARTSLERVYPDSTDHFRQVSKKIRIATGTNKESTRAIEDYKLTRRACYVIAQNGDSRKEAIALAQNYFASQTRKQELLETKEKEIERILARKKLSETEKKFSGVMTERGITGREIAEIKSSGDEALFGNPTSTLKDNLGIRKQKPLADHLPTISIKAKDLATEMSVHNTNEKNLAGKNQIKSEHNRNNCAVRKMLTENGIYPERLPSEEDVKKLERKYTQDEIKELAEHKLLGLELIEIDISNVSNNDELEKIQSIIKSNQGDSMIKIHYGMKGGRRVIEREIQINSEVLRGLREYIVVTH